MDTSIEVIGRHATVAIDTSVLPLAFVDVEANRAYPPQHTVQHCDAEFYRHPFD